MYFKTGILKTYLSGSSFANVVFWEDNIENVFFEGAILKMYFLRDQSRKTLMKITFYLTHAL